MSWKYNLHAETCTNPKYSVGWIFTKGMCSWNQHSDQETEFNQHSQSPSYSPSQSPAHPARLNGLIFRPWTLDKWNLIVWEYVLFSNRLLPFGIGFLRSVPVSAHNRVYRPFGEQLGSFMRVTHSYHVSGTHRIVHSLLLGTTKWNRHSTVKEGKEESDEGTDRASRARSLREIGSQQLGERWRRQEVWVADLIEININH